MSDTDYEYPRPEPESEEDAERDNRSMGTLGTILVIVVVVILVLLFWRGCANRQTRNETSGGGAVITSVPGLNKVDAGVAVWVKPGIDIDTVLERNGLGDAAYTDFGEGTFVIEVETGKADSIVRKLKNDEGLYDAGYLYSDNAK